ncbi:TetR/AcrR family transcriptional regulator [Brevundimonas faecalis]|uniref:AcrR family transcriptional regulator n=1 Tax=Brevundimonas faecalis TaxID=947378 RepID=A0ABV2RCJ0_9CAUL
MMDAAAKRPADDLQPRPDWEETLEQFAREKNKFYSQELGSSLPDQVPVMAAEPEKAPNQRQAAKARTRAKVLAAARHHFKNDGYAGATIRAMAATMEMSTGAIFANFPGGKDELYVTVHGHKPLTPEDGLTLVWLLRRAEAILAGFEGDPMQDGLDELLADIAMTLPDLPPEEEADV